MSIVRTNLTRLGVATVASAALGAATVSLPGNAGGTTPGHARYKTLTKHPGTHAAPATPPTLTGTKADAAAAVEKRITSLDAAASRTGAAKDLGSGQAALSAYLGTDIQPLLQQGRTVAADDTVAQAQTDYLDIFVNFRVYRLVLPAAAIARQADRVANTEVPALTAAAAKAQGAINHRNQATIEPLVQDLDHQIAAASTATQGLAATVLAYTPAQWNADYSLLSPATSSITTANVAIHRAQADVVQIRQDLHHVVHGGRAKALHLDLKRSRRL